MTTLNAATTSMSHQNGMALVLTGAASVDKHPQAPTNTFNIPFWWDIIVVIVFSVLIYLWAMRTKLPRDEMLLLVNKQGGEEELPPAPHH